jgi:hypothetical protein
LRFQSGSSCGAIVTPEIFAGSVANFRQLGTRSRKPLMISLQSFLRRFTRRLPSELARTALAALPQRRPL